MAITYASFLSTTGKQFTGENYYLSVLSSLLLTTVNLRFVVAITFPNNPKMKPITLYADPVADPGGTYPSYALFDIGAVLSKAMLGNPDLRKDFPIGVIHVPFPRTELSIIYDIDIFEYSGSPAAISDTYSMPGQSVILGGSDFATKYYSPWLQTELFEKFHSFMPDFKRTYPDQAEFLTWWVDTPGTYSVWIQTILRDGSSRLDSLGAYPVPTAPALCCTNVGYAFLALVLPTYQAFEDIYCIEVSVQLVATTICSLRTINFDQEYYPFRKSFIWLNSSSGLETFSFTGKSSLTSEISATEVNQYYEPSQYLFPGNALRRSTNRREQATIKVSSGFQKKETIDALRDMLLSEFVAEQRGEKYIPIEIVPGSFKITEDDQDTYSLEMEYRYLFDNAHYSPW